MPAPYPNIPAGFGLVRHKFTAPVGVGHAMVLYGVELTGTPTAAAVADEMADNWETDMLIRQPSACNLVQTTAVINLGGTLSTGEDDTVTAGSNGTNAMNPNVAVLIKKSTGLIGKHFRGRLYVPYPSQSDFPDASQDKLGTTALANWQAQAATWISHFATSTTVSAMVLLHRSTLVAPTVVSALTVEQLSATQSRRLRKVAHR